METITSVDALCSKISVITSRRSKLVVGIDGLDGVGKTTLARDVAHHLGAKIVSLDDYLEKKKDAYVAHLHCIEIQEVLRAANCPVVMEGVCLRAAAKRCGISVDIHIYVRRIGRYGNRDDEEICLTTTPAEELKEKMLLFRRSLATVSGDGNYSCTPERIELGLTGEIIDYHAQYMPVKEANIVFDMVEQ